MRCPSTRRAVLAGSIFAATSVLVAAAAALPSITAGADAELIALGADLRKAWDIEKEIEASSGLPDDAFDTAYENCSVIVDQIEALAATTLAGLQVKVLALSWTHCGEPFEDTFFDEKGTTTDYRLAMSIIRDILEARTLS